VVAGSAWVWLWCLLRPEPLIYAIKHYCCLR
jgi:hypothetical protein